MGKNEILQQWLDKGNEDLRATEYLSSMHHFFRTLRPSSSGSFPPASIVIKLNVVGVGIHRETSSTYSGLVELVLNAILYVPGLFVLILT